MTIRECDKPLLIEDINFLIEKKWMFMTIEENGKKVEGIPHQRLTTALRNPFDRPSGSGRMWRGLPSGGWFDGFIEDLGFKVIHTERKTGGGYVVLFNKEES